MSILSNIISHRLFRNTSIYTITNTIRQAIPFLLLPVLTRYLTTSDYGIISIFEILLLLTIISVELNTTGAVAVNFFKLKKENLKIYIGNTILTSFISFVLISVIIYSCKTQLSYLIKFPENWLIFLPVVAFAQFFVLLILTLWQVEEKALAYGLFQIFQTIFDIGLSLVLIILLGFKWQGRLSGAIITPVIFSFIAIAILSKRKYLALTFNKEYVKDALLFGLPLIPHALGAWIISSIGRIFINSMVGINETGIYTVGCQIGMIIGLLATSFNKAWVPFFYRKLNENSHSTNLKIVKLTYMYYAGIVILALSLGFIAPYFVRVFVSKTFYPAYKYVIWVALGYAAQGMYFMVANYIFYVKKTYILAGITFICALTNIALNYFLIKHNGAIGAAQSMTITFFMFFILTWVLSAKVYKMPWLLWKIK